MPFPKKLDSTEVSVPPSHSQSISSRSSDSRMKELTIPTPAEAFMTTSTCPNMMYSELLIVGALVEALIWNSAPEVPYTRVVPSASVHRSEAPLVKSVKAVFPLP